MSESPTDPEGELPDDKPGPRGRPTPTRLVLWIVGAGFAIYLIVTGVVGILTKAR